MDEFSNFTCRKTYYKAQVIKVTKNNAKKKLEKQSQETPPIMRGFVFSNYWRLKKMKILLKSDKSLKRKWQKTKNDILNLHYIKAL